MRSVLVVVLWTLLLFLPSLRAQEPSTITQEDIYDEPSQDPDSLADLESQAQQRFAEDDVEGALTIFRQLADGHTDTAKKAEALVQAAWMEDMLERGDSALATLTEALVLKPDLRLRAELFSESFGDLFLEAQKEAFERRDDRAFAALGRGLEHLRARRYAPARQAFDAALGYRTDHPQALYNLALVDLYEGHNEKALGGFQKVVALAESRPGEIDDQTRGRALTNVGFLYNRRQLFAEAETALEEAVRFFPGNSSAWSNLGVSRRRLGKKVPAAEAFRRAHELDPDDPGVMNNLALAYIDTEDWVSAVALLKGATERFSDNASLWLNFGLAQRGLGNLAGAVESFESAIRHDPGNGLGWAAAAAVHLANHYLSAGDHARVLETADRILGWKSDSASGWSYRGLAQWKSGDLEAARQSLEEARRLDPTRAQTHNNLGSVYMELGLLPQAEEALRRALAIDPSLGEARENLAALEARRGTASAARTSLPGSTGAARPPLVSPPPSAARPPTRARLGLRFADIDYSALGLKGVMVADVVTGTLASRADIRPKDLILKVDGRDVTSPEELERYVRETDKTSVVLDLLRDNLPKRIEMRLD